MTIDRWGKWIIQSSKILPHLQKDVLRYQWFWDINDNDKKSNDRSNENDYDDENFDDRKVHCDAVEFDDIYDCYDHDDSNDDEFYIKKFHGDVTEINDNDKYDDYDDVKFVCIRFHSAS